LIVHGQFESGVMDALCPDVDDDVNLEGRLPERIAIRPPEGYAYYSLYPEMYRHAAIQFVQEQRPSACVVVGIRSIGTSLSAVVAEPVDAVWRFTVRPRGHPFDRELRLSAGLQQRIRSHADAWFLVVDEGPGISGSSFISVASKLEELGLPADRIVLFPSHDPEPARLRSEKARATWRRYRRYVEPFRADQFVPSNSRDISGGGWRELTGSDAAVQPQHERRKYLHENRLWKFSGLAHFGRARHERAKRLAGFCPRACGFSNGFLVTEWMSGRAAPLTDDLLDAMARYLAFLRAEFATGQPVPGAALEQMIEVNTGQCLPAPVDGVVVAGDGRMLPHEWLQTDSGYVKTDALDHHDDHFFPGCQDIAWDIAGAAVEWGFPVEALADRYLRLHSDSTLRSRLDFYVTAYKAYRLGYCTMAIETLGDSADGRRFRDLLPKYGSACP
jgi:hypothetical protein